MKFIAHVCLIGLVFGGALGAPAVWAAPAEAPAKAGAVKTALAITRDNFVSLSWQQTGGFAGISTAAEIQGNVVSYSGSGVRRVTENGATTTARAPQTRGLSNNQLNRLVEKMNASNLTALVGNYRQNGLSDGFNETLILTVSDENGEDREFVIQNYGDTAPKAYLDFVAYFRGILDKKFAPRARAVR